MERVLEEVFCEGTVAHHLGQVAADPSLATPEQLLDRGLGLALTHRPTGGCRSGGRFERAGCGVHVHMGKVPVDPPT